MGIPKVSFDAADFFQAQHRIDKNGPVNSWYRIRAGQVRRGLAHPRGFRLQSGQIFLTCGVNIPKQWPPSLENSGQISNRGLSSIRRISTSAEGQSRSPGFGSRLYMCMKICSYGNVVLCNLLFS